MKFNPHLEESAPELAKMLREFVSAFKYDPGHSDLDNEQPIHITVPLGTWRRASRLLTKVQS